MEFPSLDNFKMKELEHLCGKKSVPYKDKAMNSWVHVITYILFLYFCITQTWHEV